MAKKRQKHRWDETLVISVLVVAALSVLIILASYITVTGNAFSSMPTEDSIKSLLNGAMTISGNGKMICNQVCNKVYSVCVLAHGNEQIIGCGQPFKGDYQCLCAKT